MDVSKIFLEGGTTAATLWIIYTLIKDKDKIIQNNIDALNGVKNTLERLDITVNRLAQQDDEVRRADLESREQLVTTKEKDLRALERRRGR